MACRLPAEDLRSEPKPELTRCGTERLKPLLQMLDLLRDDLDQLLELLELRWQDLKQ